MLYHTNCTIHYITLLYTILYYTILYCTREMERGVELLRVCSCIRQYIKLTEAAGREQTRYA